VGAGEATPGGGSGRGTVGNGRLGDGGRGVGVDMVVGPGVGTGDGVGVGTGVEVGLRIVSDTVVGDDQATPSQTRYENVAVPDAPPPGEYDSRPLGSRSSDPLMPLADTSSAMSRSPSPSVSLAMTPGAAITMGVRGGVEYASALATGIAFRTVMVTVAGVDSRALDNRYRKLSVPT